MRCDSSTEQKLRDDFVVVVGNLQHGAVAGVGKCVPFDLGDAREIGVDTARKYEVQCVSESDHCFRMAILGNIGLAVGDSGRCFRHTYL